MDEIFFGPVSLRAKTIAILGSLILFYVVIFFIRKGILKTGYSIVWFLVIACILIISISPKALFLFSNLIGIYYAPSAVFSILIIGIILITVNFSVVLSSHEKKIKTLSQEIGLLNEKLEGKTNNVKQS